MGKTQHGAEEGGFILDNAGIARVFDRIADLLEIIGENSFKINAYRRAAATIMELGEDIADVWREDRVGAIPGIGEALDKKIDELMRTGSLEYLQRLQSEVPAGVMELLQIPGVGPKYARIMWQAGITSLTELESVAKAGSLKELRGVGSQLERKILDGVSKLRQKKHLI